jgi:hypothetical protein
MQFTGEQLQHTVLIPDNTADASVFKPIQKSIIVVAPRQSTREVERMKLAALVQNRKAVQMHLLRSATGQY